MITCMLYFLQGSKFGVEFFLWVEVVACGQSFHSINLMPRKTFSTWNTQKDNGCACIAWNSTFTLFQNLKNPEIKNFNRSHGISAINRIPLPPFSTVTNGYHHIKGKTMKFKRKSWHAAPNSLDIGLVTGANLFSWKNCLNGVRQPVSASTSVMHRDSFCRNGKD